MIGSGSFGHVYKCRHVKTGKEYAVKKFKNKYPTKKKAFDQREIQVLQRFDQVEKRNRDAHCPYVMKAERIEFENRRLYLVFELMDMSLTQFIRKRGRKGLLKLDEEHEIKTIAK
jgi:serine/threonine protein kinase